MSLTIVTRSSDILTTIPTSSLLTPTSQWYPEVLHFCPSTPLVLVGLKSDLRTKRTCIELLRTQGLTPVTPEQGAAVARKMGAQYIECSAKESKGINEVFELAINTAVQVEEAAFLAPMDVDDRILR